MWCLNRRWKTQRTNWAECKCSLKVSLWASVPPDGAISPNTDWWGVSTCSLEAPPLMRPQMICSTLSGSLMWTVVFSNWGICRGRETQTEREKEREVIISSPSNFPLTETTALKTLDQHDSKKDFSSDCNTPAFTLSLVVLVCECVERNEHYKSDEI